MVTPTKAIRKNIDAAKAETRSLQAHRIVEFLYHNGPTLTPTLCQETATQNLSAAANAIRPALEKRGLTIVAELRHPLILNRFGERSMSHTWRLQRLS